jgi:hypothetical protein
LEYEKASSISTSPSTDLLLISSHFHCMQSIIWPREYSLRSVVTPTCPTHVSSTLAIVEWSSAQITNLRAMLSMLCLVKKNMKQHWALAKTLSSGSIYSGISDFSEQLSERTV